MYHHAVIHEKLKVAGQYLGWSPEIHSIDEVDRFNDHMKTLLEETDNRDIILRRELTKKEVWWVRNERAICRADAMYFKTRYGFLCDEEGTVMRYVPRVSQIVFNQVLADFDEKQLAIEIQALKGRQLGVSTEVQLDFGHRTIMLPGVNAVSASVNAQKSELMANMTKALVEGLPWWLCPQRTKWKWSGNHGMATFRHGSNIAIQSGTQDTGIAQGWTVTCLPPTSPVRLPNGFVKSIEKITAGDFVITENGEWKRVAKAWRTTREAGPTRKLKIWGNYDALESSPDHLCLTPEDWTEAQELSVGDWVRYPVREITHDLKEIAFEHLSRGKVSDARRKSIKRKATFDLGYVCGFYLAEGTARVSGHAKKGTYISGLTFSVHKREVNSRVASLRRILQDGEAISSKATSENGAQIYIGAAWLARWVVNEFGRSHQKQIPDWVWTAGIPFCNCLLRGYFDGDGWIEADNNNVKAKSVCQQLILQTRDLVASLGYGWSSIYYHKPKPGIPNRKENWEIVLSGPTGHEYRRRWAIEKKPRLKQARHWRYAEKGRFVDLQIEAVADGFSESFYDLEVDDASHSFTTPQCCVHNCAHISEVCDYPNPKALIEEGLFKAVHTSRKVFLVLESTGNGNTGWWPDTWRSSKEFYPLGRARLFPLFLPWFVGTDIYPKRDWLQKFPIPDNWMPGPDTVKHAIKCMA